MLKCKFNKKEPIRILTAVFRYVFFISLSYIVLYPYIYILVNAVKGFADSYDTTVVWVPKSIYLGNLLSAFKVFELKETLPRTLIYEIAAALIQFCSCAVYGYGLARFKLKGKSLMMAVLILTILVPSMMIIIPSYVNFSRVDFLGILGIVSKIIGKELRPDVIGTPFVFWLPAFFGVGLKGGLFIYIYMQFFKGLPKELEEAAYIDGAGAWRTFLQIVVPSSGSAIITVLLFSIVWHWNDYYLAQMYMNEPTFSVALNNFDNGVITTMLGFDNMQAALLEIPILLSGCLLFILPILVFYILLQRKFMASIATSGIVG